jgi:hypothetical protein
MLSSHLFLGLQSPFSFVVNLITPHLQSGISFSRKFTLWVRYMGSFSFGSVPYIWFFISQLSNKQIVLFLKYKLVLFQTINRGLINKFFSDENTFQTKLYWWWIFYLIYFLYKSVFLLTWQSNVEKDFIWNMPVLLTLFHFDKYVCSIEPCPQ